MTKITIHVIAESGFLAPVDLSQETEEAWPAYIADMKNGGHTDETICRNIAERIKWMARPYLAVAARPELKVVKPKAKKPRKPRATKPTPQQQDVFADEQPTGA